ncbi:MAG: PAS domain-containing protein [Ruminococcus sp.]|nr:PAS domain-containing protein [Ruminococcus sp.]
MNNKPRFSDDILSQGISGFHVYALASCWFLSFASENLASMLGFSAEELLSIYADLVHNDDKAGFNEFIKEISEKPTTKTLEYRLKKSDGNYIYVSDTTSSKVDADGNLKGYSVLTDITDIKKENENLQFLSDTVACGFLRYTCEKLPKVTYINKQMMEILRFPKSEDGEMDYLELSKDNIFLMIPMEERRRFALYLNRVYSAGAPMAGEMTLLRCDGTRAHIFGWVTKHKNEDGTEEFQSVCMDVTEHHRQKKANEAKRYIKALSDVYSKIFEYNLKDNTVTCLFGKDSPRFKWIENIPMQMDEATEKWITGTVVEEERQYIRDFFNSFKDKKLYDGTKPSQITYKAVSSKGEVKTYNGVFIKIDDTKSLYCCRCVSDSEEALALKSENISLKENMQELVLRFSEGVAAFELKDDFVKPLYASENVCGFFGVDKDEWLPLMNKSTKLSEFVSKSEVDLDEFSELLRTGEAEFTYYDISRQENRRIKAICSPKSPSASPRYVLLYNVDEQAKNSTKEESKKGVVSIRTFGYFDVFVDEKAVAFRNKKSKELFALLVDRKGGFVTSDEAISFLWEDEPVNSVTLARYRKVALRLKNTLEEYGISDVVEVVDGKRRIATDKVQCDLYDYLSGKEEHASLFKGSYLSNYSWAETTLAELMGNILY